MMMSKQEKNEFASLYWLTQIYGQVSIRDLVRLQVLESKLSYTQSDRLENLMLSKGKVTEKMIRRALG